MITVRTTLPPIMDNLMLAVLADASVSLHPWKYKGSQALRYSWMPSETLGRYAKGCMQSIASAKLSCHCTSFYDRVMLEFSQYILHSNTSITLVPPLLQIRKDKIRKSCKVTAVPSTNLLIRHPLPKLPLYNNFVFQKSKS